MMKILLLSFISLIATVNVHATELPWRADASLAFGILQEQSKNSSGESGGRLFQSVTGATLLSATYEPLSWLDTGLFFMFETGTRSAADFGGIDSRGVPTTVSRAGGHYDMYWLGPLIRPHWKNLFLEVAYIAFGLRDDNAYSGLVSPGGSTDDSFIVDPLRAWMFALGMSTPLWEKIALTLKVEYRFLYFNRRGGDLPGNTVYGTQAIRPHIGLAFRI